jgi:hypothetical protein
MKTLIPLVAVILLTGCTDLIEEDLDGVGVVLLTPQDGDTITSNVVSFKWETVPYATEYLFQVAKPNFIAPQLYLADSVIESSSLTFPLPPGNYAWRVRGQNGSSHTNFYERRVVVEAASTLADLFPILIAPASNAALRSQDIVVSWQALGGAEDYRVELRQGDQSGPLVQAQLVSTSPYTFIALTEGVYTWGVQGQNSTSVSNFSYRGFTVDRTAPSTPLLTAPTASATVPNSDIQFQWQSGTDAATATTDSLFVTDANLVLVRQLPIAGTSYTDSLGTGVYQWSVRTTDAAGNGTTSASRTLTVQ